MQFVETTADEFQLPSEINYAFQLSIEEICTNLIKYGYSPEAPGPIEVTCTYTPGEIAINIRDQSPPFDPSQAPQPDLDVPLHDRRVGGLGVYLVRKIMDEVTYTTDDSGWNTLRVVKRWDNE